MKMHKVGLVHAILILGILGGLFVDIKQVVKAQTTISTTEPPPDVQFRPLTPINAVYVTGTNPRFEVITTHFSKLSAVFTWKIDGVDAAMVRLHNQEFLYITLRPDVVNLTIVNEHAASYFNNKIGGIASPNHPAIVYYVNETVSSIPQSYNASASIGFGELNMNFTISNTTLNGTGMELQVEAYDGSTANFTWSRKATCGALPSNVTRSNCNTFQCQANGSFDQCLVNTVFHRCFPKSICTEFASWTEPTNEILEAVACNNTMKWGSNCANDCGKCVSFPCDFQNGSCFPCTTNYTGNLCTECIPGVYGADCNFSCAVGCPTTSCQRDNGYCSNYTVGINTTGCRERWEGPACDEWICDPGKWGQDCNLTCSYGCPTVICRKNGDCANPQLSGTVTGCKVSFTGSACDTVKCNRGKYGASCNLTCGGGCPQVFCDMYTGDCRNRSTGDPETGCQRSYVGIKCSERGCARNQTWGENCSLVCGDGCEDNKCDWSTGACSSNSACLEGYKQDSTKKCTEPICEKNCNGGTCVAPNQCQLCPLHFASGKTCRNIRLDGLMKGSAPTFGSLAGVVLVLAVLSKCCGCGRKNKKNRKK